MLNNRLSILSLKKKGHFFICPNLSCFSLKTKSRFLSGPSGLLSLYLKKKNYSFLGPKKFLAFSLIELVITVAITGVLGVAALSSYSQYVIKSKVASLVEAAGPAQLAVQTFFQQTGSQHNTLGSMVNFPESTGTEPYVQAVDANVVQTIHIDPQGKINVVGTTALNQAVIALVPTIDTGGNLTWTCKTQAAFLNIVPKNCQNLCAPASYTAWTPEVCPLVPNGWPGWCASYDGSNYGPPAPSNPLVQYSTTCVDLAAQNCGQQWACWNQSGCSNCPGPSCVTGVGGFPYSCLPCTQTRSYVGTPDCGS